MELLIDLFALNNYKFSLFFCRVAYLKTFMSKIRKYETISFRIKTSFDKLLPFGKTHRPETLIPHKIRISCLNPLNGFRFFFYCVTVKTIY